MITLYVNNFFLHLDVSYLLENVTFFGLKMWHSTHGPSAALTLHIAPHMEVAHDTGGRVDCIDAAGSQRVLI